MKFFIKSLKLLSLIILLTISVAFIVITKPYLKTELIRENNKPITIRTTWVAWACGGNERITKINTAGEIAEAPLNIYVPEGYAHPEESEAAYPGNIFLLTGYFYQKKVTNLITGKQEFFESPRFDVIGWEVELPYQMIDSNGKPRQASNPLGWKLDSNQKIVFSGIDGGC